MPHVEPRKRAPVRPDEHAAHEAAKKPGPSDVHEQRQSDQKSEGVVEKKGERPPTQSLIDEERGDWEGMGQSQHQPDEPGSA
jgi:hypothetical protein